MREQKNYNLRGRPSSAALPRHHERLGRQSFAGDAGSPWNKSSFNCRVAEVPQEAQKYDAGSMGARNRKPNTLEEPVDAPDLIATSVGEMLGFDCPAR